MENSYLDYVSNYSVLQIMPPTRPKIAIVYDPILKQIKAYDVEVIGLVDCGTEEEPLIAPCYLCASDSGTFWVPDLEPTFLRYGVDRLGIDVGEFKDQIEEILKWWSTVEEELTPVKVETKGKISYIKRKKKDDDRSRTPEDT